ncbi:protocatechuate 3,4-dioxygenase beta subunit [Actinocorallia herbida]|uniref:Protocatechuate 3,4-dioxygenase beta subunit n=1 Tax=Actinocorallia herbida TaxID=58109 RepID=A0A3N1D2B9_9ACTN|nr:intradiol ring-cleavage dioxygenase [Actinocorallia herbida]ROO87675.1 protocatechuate 3,4-dioxygenase beta subunit [Actinocorallia herbida]
MTEAHDRGLTHDLSTLLARRGMLTFLGGAVLTGLIGCAPEPPASLPATPALPGTPPPPNDGAEPSAAGEIPDETAGPYPADGSNGPDILTRSGIVRSDIRTSFGGSVGTAEGIPLTLELTLTDSGRPLAGAAVYLWHCDREGRYSMYSEGVTAQNYLRGVQEADKNGTLGFTTIFPGCYPGRWPHIHFEIYASLNSATAPATPTKITQLAFPEAVCEAAYATTGYSAAAQSLPGITLESDTIFSDGHDLQLATVTGSATTGYKATLNVLL